MDKTFFQYWFEFEMSHEEAYDKMMNWFSNQHKLRVFKRRTIKPKSIDISLGKGLASPIKGGKRYIDIHIFENLDKTLSNKGYCGTGSSAIAWLQVYPCGKGKMTDNARKKVKSAWDLDFFPTLWDAIESKPLNQDVLQKILGDSDFREIIRKKLREGIV